MTSRILACVIVFGAVAGCATPQGAPPAPTASAAAPVASAPAGSGGSVNGVYRGRSTMLARSGTGVCAVPGPVTVPVRNGRIVRRWNDTTTLETTVQPDGTFSAQAGRASFTGTIQNGHLEADIGSEYCRYHYSLDRS